MNVIKCKHYCLFNIAETISLGHNKWRLKLLFSLLFFIQIGPVTVRSLFLLVTQTFEVYNSWNVVARTHDMIVNNLCELILLITISLSCRLRSPFPRWTHFFSRAQWCKDSLSWNKINEKKKPISVALHHVHPDHLVYSTRMVHVCICAMNDAMLHFR